MPSPLSEDAQALLDEIMQSRESPLAPAFGIAPEGQPYNVPYIEDGNIGGDTGFDGAMLPAEFNGAMVPAGQGMASAMPAPDPFAGITFPSAPAMRPLPRAGNQRMRGGFGMNPYLAGIATLLGGSNAVLPAMVSYGRGLQQQDQNDFAQQRQYALDTNAQARQGWQDESNVGINRLRLASAQEAARRQAMTAEAIAAWRKAQTEGAGERAAQGERRLGFQESEGERKKTAEAMNDIMGALRPGMSTEQQARIVKTSNKAYGTSIPVPGERDPLTGKYNPRYEPPTTATTAASLAEQRRVSSHVALETLKLRQQMAPLQIEIARLTLEQKKNPKANSEGYLKVLSSVQSMYANAVGNYNAAKKREVDAASSFLADDATKADAMKDANDAKEVMERLRVWRDNLVKSNKAPMLVKETRRTDGGGKPSAPSGLPANLPLPSAPVTGNTGGNLSSVYSGGSVAPGGVAPVVVNPGKMQPTPRATKGGQTRPRATPAPAKAGTSAKSLRSLSREELVERFTKKMRQKMGAQGN